jgi:hypothetical protein
MRLNDNSYSHQQTPAELEEVVMPPDPRET